MIGSSVFSNFINKLAHDAWTFIGRSLIVLLGSLLVKLLKGNALGDGQDLSL